MAPSSKKTSALPVASDVPDEDWEQSANGQLCMFTRGVTWRPVTTRYCVHVPGQTHYLRYDVTPKVFHKTVMHLASSKKLLSTFTTQARVVDPDTLKLHKPVCGWKRFFKKHRQEIRRAVKAKLSANDSMEEFAAIQSFRDCRDPRAIARVQRAQERQLQDQEHADKLLKECKATGGFPFASAVCRELDAYSELKMSAEAEMDQYPDLYDERVNADAELPIQVPEPQGDPEEIHVYANDKLPEDEPVIDLTVV